MQQQLDYPFATLAMYKERMGITTTDYDASLTVLLAHVTNAIEQSGVGRRLRRWHQRVETFRENKILTSKLMIDSILFNERIAWKSPIYGEDHPYLVVARSVDKLQVRTQLFDQGAWWPDEGQGLRDQVNASKKKGMSATGLEPWGLKSLLTYVCAGRVMIQVNAPDGAWVSLMTVEKHDDHEYLGGSPEDYPRHRMGVHGIHATEEQAELLLEGALKAFLAGGVELQDDTQVGVI